MELASIILSTIALILSIACMIWMGAKALSSHSIQYVNPFEKMMGSTDDPLTQEMGRGIGSEFQEIGSVPIDEDKAMYGKSVKQASDVK